MSTIKKHWWSYLEQVMPKEAPLNQVIETRRAFYAGASAMMAALVEISCVDRTEEDADKMMAELQEELDGYLETVGTDEEVSECSV